MAICATLHRRAPFAAACLIAFAASTARPSFAADPHVHAPTGAPVIDAGAEPPHDDASVDSPRASVARFLDLCRAGEYAEAAGYLDLVEGSKAEGPTLARRLKAVLDHEPWFNLEHISAKAQGDTSDRLPAWIDEIGVVQSPSGPEPVRLVRRHVTDGTRWLFSANTVGRINAWHKRLRDHWIEEHLPPRLLQPGPKDLLLWQWIALPALFSLTLALGYVLGYLTRRLIARVFKPTKATLDHTLLAGLTGPLTLTWGLVGVDLALPLLELVPTAEAFLQHVLRAAYLAVLFWLFTSGVDIGKVRLLDLPHTRQNPAAMSLIPLGARALQLAIASVAAVFVLSELGFPVASLLAGLGIGGVGLALAAQKTVENLFGSLSIGVDQPFRVGDTVTVDGLTGAVESIGLRSTRIRTLDRTLVTIPNGKLADLRIESLTARDRIKLGCTLALAQSTPPALLRSVLERLRTHLKADPKVWPEFTVALTRITAESIDVEIQAWFTTTSWDEFVVLREQTLLTFLEALESAGVRLAVPLRAVQIPAGGTPHPMS